MLRFLLIGLLLPGCLLAQGGIPIPVTRQEVPAGLDVTQLGGAVSGLAASWMARIKSEGVPETKSLEAIRTDAGTSPALAKLPLARKGIVNVCSELIAITEAKARATTRLKEAMPEKKPFLSTVSAQKWAEEEQEKVRKQWRNRIGEAEKTLQKNIGLIQKSIIAPGGREFLLPADDPFLMALQAARFECDLVLSSLQRPSVPLELDCQILQVMGNGCLVLAQDKNRQTRQIFVPDLVSSGLKVGQVLPLVLKWEGVYRHTAPDGNTSVLESWKLVRPVE